MRLIKSIGFLTLAGLLQAGCSSKSADTAAQMHIQFPSVSESKIASAKVSASSTPSALIANFDWALVCYAVNVSASDISKSPAGSCDVPLSIFKGTVPPGGDLLLKVPKGGARTVDVLVYSRATAAEPCPTLDKDFSTLSRTRIARVGQTNGVDMFNDNVEVSVDISAPAAGTTLLSQYNLPDICKPIVPTQGSSTSRVAEGHSVITGGNFKISGTISSKQAERVLSGGNFVMHLSRQAQ